MDPEEASKRADYNCLSDIKIGNRETRVWKLFFYIIYFVELFDFYNKIQL